MIPTACFRIFQINLFYPHMVHVYGYLFDNPDNISLTHRGLLQHFVEKAVLDPDKSTINYEGSLENSQTATISTVIEIVISQFTTIFSEYCSI